MTVDVVAALTPGAAPARPALHLVHGPYLVVRGQRRELPDNARRVLALVALREGRLARRSAASTLWPDDEGRRAAGNLRSALWRLRGADIDLVEVDRSTLRLRPDTLVDVHLATAWAARMIEGRPAPVDLTGIGWQAHAFDLLPGWYDDWVVLARERLRQRMLHGLEAMSRLLVGAGRPAHAVAAARIAVTVDPLRESGQRVLIQAHLAVGDTAAARRCVDGYRALLAAELGVGPRAELTGLVTG
jgi:DNA-binding SARP family transcriptional activator